MVAMAEAAEESGFDSIWVADQADSDPDGPFEAYTLLGALAVCTRRARLGALTSSVTHRGPGILAKQVTALDILSSGRAVLGVGPGSEEPGRGDQQQERYDRFEEALDVLESLLGKGATDRYGQVSFSGRFYQLERAPNRPRPVQDGTLPVLVSVCDLETLKLVARYGDACIFEGDHASTRRQLSVLERHMEEADRDPSTLTKTALIHVGRVPAGTESIAEDAAGYRKLGIDAVIVMLPETWDERDDAQLRPARDLVSAIGRAVSQ